MISVALKKPQVAKKFSEERPWDTFWPHSCDFFPRKTEGQSVLAVGRHSSVHVLRWRINRKSSSTQFIIIFIIKIIINRKPNSLKDFLQKSKRFRDIDVGMKLLANKVNIQGMEVLYWLTKCINKIHNVKWLCFTQLSLHKYSGMADTTLFYCYLFRDGCVKCSHLHCGSWFMHALIMQPVILPFLVCELS